MGVSAARWLLLPLAFFASQSGLAMAAAPRDARRRRRSFFPPTATVDADRARGCAVSDGGDERPALAARRADGEGDEGGEGDEEAAADVDAPEGRFVRAASGGGLMGGSWQQAKSGDGSRDVGDTFDAFADDGDSDADGVDHAEEKDAMPKRERDKRLAALILFESTPFRF